MCFCSLPRLCFRSLPRLCFCSLPRFCFRTLPRLCQVVGAFVQGGQYFRARWSPYLCKVCFCFDHLARPNCLSIPSGPFGAFKVCGIKAHLARLTPFSVSKWGILLTKSLSQTHSVSKTAILLTKSLPKTNPVSKTAILLTKSPSKTNSVSKSAILLTKSLSETHSVSKMADLLTNFVGSVLTTPLLKCALFVGRI